MKYKALLAGLGMIAASASYAANSGMKPKGLDTLLNQTLSTKPNTTHPKANRYDHGKEVQFPTFGQGYWNITFFDMKKNEVEGTKPGILDKSDLVHIIIYGKKATIIIRDGGGDGCNGEDDYVKMNKRGEKGDIIYNKIYWCSVDEERKEAVKIYQKAITEAMKAREIKKK